MREKEITMSDIKVFIIGTVLGFLTLLTPIRDFMASMLVLFTLNFMFGLFAARMNNEDWSWKKAAMFFVSCFIFFVTVASLFVAGHYLHSDEQAVFCVRYICIAAMYLFTTNILRNWRKVLVPGTTWYLLVDFVHYVMSCGFVDKMPIFKKYQEYKKKEENGSKQRTDVADNA